MPSMDYNPRMSMARSSQQSSQQKQRKEEDGNAFMVLPDREIAGCISDIGLQFTVEDLRKPNPQHIQKIFEHFGELLTNTTREVVAPAMKKAAEDMYGDDADRIFPPDNRELMAFFVTMRRLLNECGILDFTFSDLMRPTHARLVKIFSYIINFVRFRESQTSVIDEHYDTAEHTKNKIEQLYLANQDKEDQLREMQLNRKNVEQAIRDKERKSADLKARLLELKKSQERVTDKLERVKSEQSRMKALLEDKTSSLMTLRAETAKLRPYTDLSPANLETALQNLSSTLTTDRSEIDRLDRRTRALQTSLETFTLLTTDISALHRVLTDLQAELGKEEAESRTAAQHKEMLGEVGGKVREVEREERLLKMQVEMWVGRTERLRTDAEMRAGRAREKMEALRGVHAGLMRERRERGEEVERRRGRIEIMEKKMADLKETIDREVSSAREEYMKMESHIRLYITEMEQSI
ncbi:putative kinetochore protein NUF2 [Teratosphaeria destructans]|uniref:Probable kinetochore protein NUF2 n=1 Tax=Teratosphaeria destructans TaxID=418781 RepID=A0A9W7VXY2_9PEZI|nr:putative kinetochore protein NUF2 [Teratosphaeria destructans]